jgi:hypothetical protein
MPRGEWLGYCSLVSPERMDRMKSNEFVAPGNGMCLIHKRRISRGPMWAIDESSINFR